MGFLRTSIGVFFSRKQQRKDEKKEQRKCSSASLQEEEGQQQGTEKASNSSRRRLKTFGGWRPNMESYNRHISRNSANLQHQQRQRQQQQQMSKKCDQAKLLSQFELVLVQGCRRSVRSSRRPDYCDCCPIARSGHRIFACPDFVYVVGGYNPTHTPDSTYSDIWRFNRLTELWQKCSMMPNSALQLPNSLASFSLVDCPNAPNECYIFGGTGVPFGVAASDQLHWIRIDPRGNIHIQAEQRQPAERHAAEEEQLEQRPQWDEAGRIVVEDAQPQQQHLPPRMYGHAMCRRMEVLNGGKLFEVLFLAGGTTGHIYNMDVWRLDRPLGQLMAPWKCTQLNRHGFEIGRYRLEIAVYDQMLYTFGGGAPDFCAEFNELLAFNLVTNDFEIVKTRPDSEFGVPQGRKCHALVQRGHLVYIIGGCRDAEGIQVQPQHRFHRLTNDVWQFNLQTFQWTRMRANMPKPVFFHSATLTPDECLFVFGGCTDESSQTRCNQLQRLWLQPPSLKYFASTTLVRAVPEAMRKRINNEGIRLSDTEALISRIFAPSLAA